jgi:type VI protein secretion system component VasK
MTRDAEVSTRRWSGPLVVVVLLVAGILYWVISAQAQRSAIGKLKQQLEEVRAEAVAASALAEERRRELERLRERLEALESGQTPDE